MENHQNEVEVPLTGESETVEGLLRTFWEKARTAADLITNLRRENQELRGRVEQLERERGSLRSEVQTKEAEVKRLRVEQAELRDSNGHETFTNEDKENLKATIRELIARINSHL